MCQLIVRNPRTGVIHLGYENAVITRCGAPNRAHQILPVATKWQIENSVKCNKCFPKTVQE